MNKIIRRFFSVERMLKENQRTDEDLPESSEVYKNAVKTAWPSALEAFLVGLIGLCDTIMVGALGGDKGTRAIAAVGITGQPRMILLALVFSLNVGVTAVVARRRGENDRQRANETLAQSLLICMFIVMIMSVAGIVFARELLYFAGAQDDIIDIATIYFQITTIGYIFSSLGMVINAAQRGMGNTRISMHTNIIANIINLVFNFLLINGRFGFPRLEVAGAAIATTMGNVVMFVICLMHVLKKDGFLHLEVKPRNFKLRRDTVKSIMNVSSSAFVEQICMRIGFFMYVKFVAGLGTIALSTHQMCMNILNISFTFGDGLSVAAASLVGRSLGARRRDMAIVYGKVLQRLALMISCVLFCIFILGRNFFMSIFTDDLYIIAMGAQLLVVIAVVSPFQTSQVVISGALRGAGDTKFVAVTSFVSIALIRPSLTWFLCYGISLGLIGAWLSLLFDQIIRLTMNFWRFTQGKWTEKVV